MPEIKTLPENLHHIHIMGIGGTAMAALAGLLVDAGYKVTGSDGNKVYPPMSDVLNTLGIEPMVGYLAENLSVKPDLVVVGNVVRAIYDEAQTLLQSDIPYMSFPSLLGAMFLSDKRNIVIAGTHGKTTTTSIASWVLTAAAQKPGFLIGGQVANFNRTAKAAVGDYFVLEGDEYDTAFFDKGPKFLHYRPHTAILTSVEFDHADIYRDLAHCQESFIKLAKILPKDGCLVSRWDHDSVVECSNHTNATIRRYGPGQTWDGEITGVDTTTGKMQFTVLKEGKKFADFSSSMVGVHNLYNQVAITAALDFYGITADQMREGFDTFKGIRRRQEIVGSPAGVSVIDDFAHHPSAVKLTLEGLRMKFGGRRLWAIFEPRSATSRRKIMQEEYQQSFDEADIAIIAPPYDQSRIAKEDRLDPRELVRGIQRRGNEAFYWGERPQGVTDWSTSHSAAAIADQVAANVLPEDVVAVLSNGGFGGIHKKLIEKITKNLENT